MEKRLKTVVMAFSFDIAGDVYRVYFLEADGMKTLPWSGKYKTQEPLFRIVNASYQLMSAERQLERALLSTRRGMVRLRLLEGQYERLRISRRKPLGRPQ